jgi:hypothetical protein
MRLSRNLLMSQCTGEAFFEPAVVLGELPDLRPQGVVLGDGPAGAQAGTAHQPPKLRAADLRHIRRVS